MSKKIIRMENFILVEERKGTGPLIIQALGYTSDEKAIKEPWIMTQVRTIPHSDRSHLPDPFIFQYNNFMPYEYLDCHVWTLYFRPECTGLEVALKEFAGYYASLPEKPVLIGFSKGGLFFGALTDCLEDLKLALVVPTLKTVTGDEEEMLRRLDKRESSFEKRMEKLLIKLLKKLVKIIGSRRPIDRDMSIGSEFLQNHTLKNLSNNNSLLIIATGSEESLADRLCLKFGQFMNLSKNSDGMTEEVKGLHAHMTVDIHATHISVMSNIITQWELYKFLRKR